MTDAALIAIATSSAGVTVVTVGTTFVLSWWLRDAKDASARYQAQCSTLTEQGRAKDKAITSLAADLKTANERVEALDAENKKLRAAQPVGGSFDRLFPPEAASSAYAHRGEGVVPGQPAADKADPSGPDGLLKPGE